MLTAVLLLIATLPAAEYQVIEYQGSANQSYQVIEYVSSQPKKADVVRIVIHPSKMVEWPKGSRKWWVKEGSGWLVYRDGAWKPYQPKTVTRSSPNTGRYL